jgi:non-lysosomal glucosylceramidase
MNWPILTHYDQEHLTRIAMPLGGIGTGTVSLGGRGDLRDFEIYSHPDKGFTPPYGFFTLWAKPEGEEPVVRCLEGVIEPWLYEGVSGCPVPNHGLPRFRQCTYAAAYPLAQVSLSDPEMPLDVRLEAFNPLIPAEADASGIPVVVLRYVLKNKTGRPVTASVCGSMQNFIGNDGNGQKAKGNQNEWKNGNKAIAGGLFFQPGELDPCAEQYGTLALAVLSSPSPESSFARTPSPLLLSHRLAWDDIGWNTGLLDFWDDFSADGTLDERPPARKSDTPVGSLAIQSVVPPNNEITVTFLLAWHFPNRKTWTPEKVTSSSTSECCCNTDPAQVGNYYTAQYANAWEVVEKTTTAFPILEEKTVRFVRAFCENDLPHAVKEAALFNLSTLRTQTAFRVPQGHLMGWEGCNDKSGCCYGSCTHVWNYEQTTPYLFGELAKTMREIEFGYATRDDGLMAFRTSLPLGSSTQWQAAAADGQMGCLMKLYRDWQLSGDDELVHRLWPNARKALEFCWIAGGWDADQDGIMEGCQHNTMDVEYYGPNPEIEIWYLGALRAAEEMAWYLGEKAFARRCHALFVKGRKWTDQHLYNGEYYQQEIRLILDADSIAPGLRIGMGAADLSDPAYQVGTGCVADQLVGQNMAHICGLGYLLKPAYVRKSLRSVYKYNQRKDFYSHFNNMRSYVLGEESGLLVCTYPRGNRPRQPFPYATEAWTGLEYTAAVGMLYEGQLNAGLHCIEAVRERYDGRKRNPFDEPECGHHYARAMAAWAGVLALTGFYYSAVDKVMGFTAQAGTWFWSNGYAWGTCKQEEKDGGYEVEINVLGGTLIMEKLILAGQGEANWEKGSLSESETAHFTIRNNIE